MPTRNSKLRKSKKDFLNCQNFQKALAFRIGVSRTLENSFEKRNYQEEFFIILERTDDKLSLHVFFF